MGNDGWKLRLATLLQRLRGRIERFGGGGVDGDDLFGEVQVACFRQPSYDWAHPNIEGRVWRIAQNLKASQFRRRSLVQSEGLTGDAQAVVQSPEIEMAEIFEVLRRELCPIEMKLLYQHAVLGQPLNELARQFDISAGAMRLRWMRMRQQLSSSAEVRACLLD